MNRRQARVSALDYITRVARAQTNVDALGGYLGLSDPWQGEDLHPDVDMLGDAVDEVLGELQRRVRALKTPTARKPLAPNGEA